MKKLKNFKKMNTPFKKLQNLFQTINKSNSRKTTFQNVFLGGKLVLHRIITNIIEKGIRSFLESIIRLILSPYQIKNWLINNDEFWTWFYMRYKLKRTFIFNGEKYKYFYRRYSVTWNNERCVEIPIVLNILKNYKKKKILEIGNVLSHFFDFQHDIIDKYEIADGVISQDVVDYKPTKKYDLIVTISTLEHVGWDETPREPLKIFRAIKNLKSLLTENGKIIITLPKGHNPVLDYLLRENKLKFSEQYFLKRISRSNKWKQCNWKKISKVVYGYPVRYSANGIIIGIIK